MTANPVYPVDPNHPLDSGTDQTFGADPQLSGHVPSTHTVDTELVYGYTTNRATYTGSDYAEPGTVDTTGYDAGYNLGNQEVTQNVVSITDATTTNSSATITSASNAFTSGMRDLPIRGTGIPAGTRILNVVSGGGSATLTQAATASGTVTATVGGVYGLDGLGYGAINYPAGPSVDRNSQPSGYTLSAVDTTAANGPSAVQQTAMNSPTYGQSLINGGVDQQFGSQSNFPGQAGPGASGGVFTADGSSPVGSPTADPITGVPDTLGNTGGASTTTAGVPLPTTYAQTSGNQIGNNKDNNGLPLFNPDGFQASGSGLGISGERDTSNTMFRHDGVGIKAPDSGAVTAPPTSYVLTNYDTLYGYPYGADVQGSTGTAPTAPQNVSWTFGAGCANVTWTPPASTGGNTIREYVVEGYQVANQSYIPLTNTNANKFTMQPSVTWRGHGGSFIAAAPVQAALVASTTGGTLAAGTYYYVVTAVGSTGETIASNEQSVTTTGTTSSVTVSWAAVTGAVSYNVYRSTSTGTEKFLANDNASPYLDTGTATGAASAPTTNTAVANGLTARVEHLTPGNYYWFRVYCRNDVGTSPMSDAASSVPSAPNNTPKYFMGYGMSGTTNTEINEASLITTEFVADSMR